MPAKPDEAVKRLIAQELYTIAELFDDWRTKHNIHEVCICLSRLSVALLSKWHDLHRLKTFHEILIADKFKESAFLTYWILKLQPVQSLCDIHAPSAMITKKMVANAIFAQHIAWCRLELNARTVPIDMLRNMLYTFLYRSVSPEHLALTYQAIMLSRPS